jgi:Arc/MetJ-type ribon-helix-helix transcriptional regulator
LIFVDRQENELKPVHLKIDEFQSISSAVQNELRLFKEEIGKYQQFLAKDQEGTKEHLSDIEFSQEQLSQK